MEPIAGTVPAIYPIIMFLPVEYRDGWAKFPVGGLSFDGSTERGAEPFKEGTRGRLYFFAPHLRPGAIDAKVSKIDHDGVVFRFTGPAVAPPPLETIPRARRVHLSGSWLWAWEAPDSSSV
jgi:hypothetical protein